MKMKLAPVFAALMLSLPVHTAAQADILEEHYILDEQLAADIEDAREQARRYTLVNGHLTAREEFVCPEPSLPAEDWALLASDDTSDRGLFYNKLGRHLGLVYAYNPRNSYDNALFFAKTDVNLFHVTLRDAFADQPETLEKIKDVFVRDNLAGLHYQWSYWPPELHDAGQADMIKIQVSGSAPIRELFSNLLMPRAVLRRQMFLDEAAVCSATQDDRAVASDRARLYYNGAPIRAATPK